MIYTIYTMQVYMHDSADFGCICMMVYMHEMEGVYPYTGVYINEMRGVYMGILGICIIILEPKHTKNVFYKRNISKIKMACGAIHIVFISFDTSRKSNSIVISAAYVLDNPST